MIPTLDRDRLRVLFDISGGAYESRGAGFTEDPYPEFNRRRDSGPVHGGAPHEHLGWTGDVFFQGLPYPKRPHFTAYDYATCSEVLKDDTRFVTRVPALQGEMELPDIAILFMDGDRHRAHRTLVQPSFIPNRMTWWLDNWTSGLVKDLIGGFASDGAVDLSAEFCGVIPLLTITGSFGVSIDEALKVREAVTSDTQTYTVLAPVVLPIIEARRADPTDDLISVLVQAEMTDPDGTVHRLDDIEVLAFSLLLLAAGSGTTWKQMGITILTLLQRPDLVQAVRDDRALLRPVIEETMRWQPTDPAFARFALDDTELGGVAIPKGAVVHACLVAANRDPSRWERPDEFDPFRPAKPHIGFGHGPHTCLGMHLARMEMSHGINALLDDLDGLEIDPTKPEPKIVGIYERGPDRVPVRWKTRNQESRS